MGGDRGAGDREKRGREVYGRREKRGREAGFPRWREAGEKGKNYATLRNISQSKKCKGAGAKKYRAGTGIKGYGKREGQTPLSPPHLKGYSPAATFTAMIPLFKKGFKTLVAVMTRSNFIVSSLMNRYSKTNLNFSVHQNQKCIIN